MTNRDTLEGDKCLGDAVEGLRDAEQDSGDVMMSSKSGIEQDALEVNEDLFKLKEDLRDVMMLPVTKRQGYWRMSRPFDHLPVSTSSRQTGRKGVTHAYANSWEMSK